MIGVLCFIVLITIIAIAVAASGCSSSVIRDSNNRKNGDISTGMYRVTTPPRPGYQAKVEAQGLTYHDEPALEWSECEIDAYWNEESAIVILPEAEK